MRMNVDIRINDSGQLHEPVDLRPFGSSRSRSVNAVNGLVDRFAVMAVYFPLADLEKQQR